MNEQMLVAAVSIKNAIRALEAAVWEADESRVLFHLDTALAHTKAAKKHTKMVLERQIRDFE